MKALCGELSPFTLQPCVKPKHPSSGAAGAPHQMASGKFFGTGAPGWVEKKLLTHKALGTKLTRTYTTKRTTRAKQLEAIKKLAAESKSVGGFLDSLIS